MNLRGKSLCEEFIRAAHAVIEDALEEIEIGGITFNTSSSFDESSPHVVGMPKLRSIDFYALDEQASMVRLEREGRDHQVESVSVYFRDDTSPFVRTWVDRGNYKFCSPVDQVEQGLSLR